MEVTSNGRCPQDSTFLFKSPKVILGDFLPLIILLPVCGGKIIMGPLPCKFITVPGALNFLSITITVDIFSGA